MINFNQLRVFYRAAVNESLTSAARDLFITQPAVTAQIKALEDFCGLKLFKKKGRQVILTDQGKILLGFAKKIFEFETEIENAIADMKKLNLGTLRLGATKAYARYFMPFLIVNFHKLYPKIKIHLDEGSSLDMVNSLIQHKNELAVIAIVEDNPAVTFIPFSKEEIVLIVAPEHHLAKRGSIPLAELTKEPIIMKESGSGTRKLVNSLFSKNGTSPDVLVETSNTEFIKQLVQRGEGISFLAKAAVTLELEEKKLVAVSIDKLDLYLDMSVAYLKKQPLSPPALEFLKSLREIRAEVHPTLGTGALMGKILSQPW